MKRAPLTILLLLSMVCFAQAQTDQASQLKRWHETRDESFRNRAQTPLTSAGLLKFKGLEYFDLNEKFIVKARFDRTEDERIFMMPTVNGGKPLKYFKRGILKFELDGRSFSLTAFQSEAAAKKNYALFVPFRDLTSGAETYGTGRYLDIKTPAGAEVILDFNYAFNPNCAYGNDQYVCPVAPRENFLQIEIKAGEKIFPDAEKQ